jgi:phosphohistidine phosphatase SixA
VGHEPQLSEIVLLVTGGRVHMRKAMLAALELPSADATQGALAWLLSWRHLQRMGGKKR